MLSIDIRRGRVRSIEYEQKPPLVKIQYLFENGDKAHAFVKSKSFKPEKIKKRIGAHVLYRVSGGVAKIVD